MTPEDLALRHPRLYHVTAPGALERMAEYGLLPTSALLDLFGVPPERRVDIEGRPRSAEVTIEHPTFGMAVISDNTPLSVRALANRLDDGLRPSEWLQMLNERVFFWADREGLARLLGSKANRNRKRDVLVVDTLSLARKYHADMAISPINTGAAIRRPARRGLATFASLADYTYAEWRSLRGRRDRILEVSVRCEITDMWAHLVDVVSCVGALT
jgi:hypothetical protein